MIDISKIDFKKVNGLIPAIIQDNKTNKVLMLGYMNEESIQKSLELNRVTFFSRTKNRLWTKGESSNNYLELVNMLLDCDQDTLLIKVNPMGPTCHTGMDTCFEEQNEGLNFLHKLQKLIQNRKNNPQKGSYTNFLFDKGINKIAQKVGEEAVELVIEAKDDNRDLFVNEASDLLYHLIVLLVQKGVALDEVISILESRNK